MTKDHPQQSRRAAESLIEIMVTITVIGIFLTATQSLIRISVRGQQSVERQQTASALILDSFVALKNMRDTNYLRFASDVENCWNKLEVTTVSACSDGTAEIITAGVPYYLVHDFDNSPFGEWHLYEVSAYEDTFIDLYTMNGTPWYLQSGVTNADFTLEESHVFERTLTVAYGDGTDDYYDATVIVSWTDSSSTDSHSLTKTGRISNIY